VSGSSLTTFQENAAKQVLDDFTVGYPKLLTAAAQWQRFRELVVGHAQVPESRDESLESIKACVRTLLDAPADLDCEITFSGSVALERTISALIDCDRNTVVTVPGFDSIASFVERAGGREPAYVVIDPFSAREDRVASIVDKIVDSVGTVVIVSPDNPSGLTLSPRELYRIAAACGAVDATLIVDHCFALVNAADYDMGMAFRLGDACRWAALWDSSKTVELLGERFGFIFGSDAELSRIRPLLSEIQFDLPIASITIMDLALRQLSQNDELRVRDKLVWQNYLDIKYACEETGLRANAPDAGGFALISDDRDAVRNSASLADKLLRESRIALIPSRVLYPPHIVPDRDFLRISLVRPRAMVTRLCEALRATANS
jgi:aspartate/methionine/tyrosine aminotransferase